MTELLELRAIVEASPERVADLLLDVRPGGRSPLAVHGEPDLLEGDEFAVTQDGSKITISVDRATRSVAEQSEWWYRGVTTVEPDPRGSQVVRQIFNIAPGHRWAVRFLSRGPLIAAPAEFAKHVADLGRQLGCPAWVLDPT